VGKKSTKRWKIPTYFKVETKKEKLHTNFFSLEARQCRGIKVAEATFCCRLIRLQQSPPPAAVTKFFRQLCSLLCFLPSVGRSQLTAEVEGRHPRRQQQKCRPIFLYKMELQTLFHRESIADPFLIRIM
jgi:hypothetical protein